MAAPPSLRRGATRVAVIGPGAVGGAVAGWLAARAGCVVELWARTPFDELVVESPTGTLRARPRIVTRPADATPPDVVLLATKTYDVDAAAAWLEAVGGHATIAVLQNGVEQVERLAPHVDPARVVPVVVDVPADRLGPGHVRARRRGGLTIPDVERGRALAALFEGTEVAVGLTHDIRTAAWRKLCFNVGGAVCALTDRPAGVVAREDVGALFRGLVAECVAVGRAEGAALEDGLPERMLEGQRRAAPETVNSLLADRRAGRRMEIDARNGVVVRRGRVHGIATPLNAMAVTLLEVASSPAVPPVVLPGAAR